MTPLDDAAGADGGATGVVAGSSPAQLIGTAISRAYRQQYGKGPESLKVHLTGDAVFVLLRGGYSVVEESLRAAGNTAAVRDQRRAFGDMIAPSLGRTVAEIVGREVVAVLADTTQAPDLGAIVLVLASAKA